MFQLTQEVRLLADVGEPGPSVAPRQPSNQEMAEVLFNVATLLQMQSANPYRIEAYRNAAAEAAPYDDDVFMFGVYVIEECKGVGKDGWFGGTAGTSAIPWVVKQIDCTVGKCRGEVRHIPRDVFRISPEIDERVGAGVWTRRHQYRVCSNLQGC